MKICPSCLKDPSLCICAELKVVKAQTRLLILQHPQERAENLGTARLAHLCLEQSKLKIGLSWRSLSHAWGEETLAANWLVLYLGSEKPSSVCGLRILTRNNAKSGSPPAPTLQSIEGLVVLDGTWSQAKNLWWRNPWLLKLQRGVLTPQRPSGYGKLRAEPRKECLSTLETIQQCLDFLGEEKAVTEALGTAFEAFIVRLSA